MAGMTEFVYSACQSIGSDVDTRLSKLATSAPKGLNAPNVKYDKNSRAFFSNVLASRLKIVPAFVVKQAQTKFAVAEQKLCKRCNR
jgi:hypothetical protein